MSYKATAWAYELPLRGPQKFVLVALADFADEAGSCYPGQERLATMTGLNERTVRRALERLEASGLIRRERRNDARGHRTSDRYYLALDTQSLPDSVPSGQEAQWADSPSLPDSVSIPTGLSDPLTIRRTTSDPSGGREPAPATPFCGKHPQGTKSPCRDCGDARRAYEAARPTGKLALVPAAPVIKNRHCPHGYLLAIETCHFCSEEQTA